MSEENNSTINEEVKPKREYRLKKKHFMIALGVLVGVLVVTYIGGFIYFNDKFLANTTINDMDVSYQSLQETQSNVKNHLESNSLEITFIDNQKESISIKDAGITYNDQNELEDLYESQNHWLWFTSFFSQNKLTIDNLLTVNDEQLNTTISQLQHTNEEYQKDPSDAKVVYSNKTFSIQSEDNGSKIDLVKLKNIILNGFSSGKTEINLLDEGGYVLPTVKSDAQQLTQLLEACKQYADVSITYETSSGDVVLDGNTIQDWLSVDDTGKYYKDEAVFKEKATAFVKELASKINTIGTRRTYTLANNRQVTVSGGNYGLKLNQSKEVEGLLEDLNNKKSGTRTPVTTGVQASTSNNGLGNTFVEVDLAAQKVYYVKNGELVLQSDCVSGKYTDSDRRTPAGTYYLYFKQRNRTLRGTRRADGTYPYESFVNYWMAFNKGIGLHDASWRNKFGGNIYYNSGSHGCINLPKSAASKLYSQLKLNTPVVCHY